MKCLCIKKKDFRNSLVEKKFFPRIHTWFVSVVAWFKGSKATIVLESDHENNGMNYAHLQKKFLFKKRRVNLSKVCRNFQEYSFLKKDSKKLDTCSKEIIWWWNHFWHHKSVFVPEMLAGILNILFSNV